MVARTNQADYISVFKGTGNENGCWSSIGRTGGKQRLSLSNGCPDVGVVVHEFMHALGKDQYQLLKCYIPLIHYTKYLKKLCLPNLYLSFYTTYCNLF